MGKRKRKPLPQEAFEATIINTSHDGRGIAQINGKKTFLFGALPGETVKFKYTKQRGRFDEGQVIDVINASPDRNPPRCPHFGMCGGCSQQHIKPEVQIKQKQEAVKELFQQAEVQPQEWMPPITGEIWGYRQKARLGAKFLAPKDKVLVGFRERNGRYIADLSRCEVLHPSVGEKITAFSTMLYQLESRSQIPQIEIAVDDSETAIIIRHLVDLCEKDISLIREFCQQHQYKLYFQRHGIDSITLDNATNPLMEYALPEFDLRLQFHPSQFTQVNADINKKMLKQAIGLLALENTDTALDLFCGIGNFTLALARHCQRVVGVEGDESAVQQAKDNAHLNAISNSEFYCANLFEPVYNEWSQQTFDKVLLDPPRSGAKEIIPMFSSWQPKRVVYVSCNPATLARDAKMLIEQGYTLEKAGVMDMFPHTKHVEAMALFVR